MLVLSRSDVLASLTLPDCIEAVEAAFRAHAEKRTLGPGVLGVRAGGGGFHIKAAGLVGDRGFFAAKITATIPTIRPATACPPSRARSSSPMR